MDSIEVDGNSFELMADSFIAISDWVIQAQPADQEYFRSIIGQQKTFRLLPENLAIYGSVLSTEAHTYNQGRLQIQVQIRA